MKPQYVFEICLERYRGIKAQLTGKVSAVNLDMPSSGYHWRPERARGAEYVADFDQAARRALCRPEWKGRLRLFEIYFRGNVEYRRAIAMVGVPEGTFDWWSSQVKKTVGGALRDAGLYPPGRYFRPRGC